MTKRKEPASHEELDEKFPDTGPGAPAHNRRMDQSHRREGRSGRPRLNTETPHPRDAEEHVQGQQEAQGKKFKALRAKYRKKS